MDSISIITAVSGAVVAFSLYMIQRLNARIDRNQHSISNVRVEIARAQQENKELQTHIHRIDKNLDDLFQKMEELLVAVRKNGKD
jgi:vacuolar-type H+-ATPase subunit D/Vma8|tara:strand:+ start:305 stop:559 length:255 start_codon:yes stop_codon:yes gene_type:complete